MLPRCCFRSSVRSAAAAVSVGAARRRRLDISDGRADRITGRLKGAGHFRASGVHIGCRGLEGFECFGEGGHDGPPAASAACSAFDGLTCTGRL
jgi:hypothetical protein